MATGRTVAGGFAASVGRQDQPAGKRPGAGCHYADWTVNHLEDLTELFIFKAIPVASPWSRRKACARPVCSTAECGGRDWMHNPISARDQGFFFRRNRAGRKLRRPGRHRHRERTPVPGARRPHWNQRRTPADRVDEQVGEIERMGRLKRFLPRGGGRYGCVVGPEKMLPSHRALLGVLFCDIRGFTAFCETAEPEETIEVLQTYHEEMGTLINAHGAGVDHRMGDGIMVLFNDPLPCDDPAGDAVRLAIAMRARMAEFARAGSAWATGWASAWASRWAMPRSAWSVRGALRLHRQGHGGEPRRAPVRPGRGRRDPAQPPRRNRRRGRLSPRSRGELSLKGLREPLEVFRLTRTETR